MAPRTIEVMQHLAAHLRGGGRRLDIPMASGHERVTAGVTLDVVHRPSPFLDKLSPSAPERGTVQYSVAKVTILSDRKAPHRTPIPVDGV